MRVERLRVERLRLFDAAEIVPGPGIAVFTGANGAGKTTLLEAIHVLAYGRSFRSPTREPLIARDATELAIYAELRESPALPLRRLGFSCTAKSWQARLDGEAVTSLGDILRHCPVVCFEPGSHALIGGSSDVRRRFLDWGLFHVEQDFLGIWRRYHRVLRQRNALLKTMPSSTDLAPWDQELADSGEALHALRQHYLDALQPAVSAIAMALMPEVGVPELRYQSGWRIDRDSLAEALAQSRTRDLATGHTSAGPHRANWTLGFEWLPSRESFSRGQEKLAALIVVLAQALHFSEQRGQWPLIVLDDLGSELDRDHQAAALRTISSWPAQVWITGTEAPNGLTSLGCDVRMFHVEQGQVRPLV